MLVIEYQSNGKRIVRLHKDWNPGRISKAYTPPMKNNVESHDAHRIQTAFIGRGIKRVSNR